MKLIDEKKFSEELENLLGEIYIQKKSMKALYFHNLLSKHLKDIVDEPHHPSGMDRDKINTRNELRGELRNG